MTRPLTVTLFEIFNFVGIAIDIARTQGFSFDDFVGTILLAGLTLWVSRGRSRIGRGVYTGLLVIGGAMMIGLVGMGYVAVDSWLVTARSLLGVILFLALLWWPTTSRWLAGNGAGAPSRLAASPPT